MKTLERPSQTVHSSKSKLWTVDECDLMSQVGILQGRYELVEGEVIEKMGQGGTHSLLIRALLNLLAGLFGLERMMVQLPIRILGEAGRYNEPLPDLAVTREGYHAYRQNPQPKDILLLLEISDSSLLFDLTTKARLYSLASVVDYWVVDVENRRLIVHRFPTVEGYDEITEWDIGESVAPLALPDVAIAIAELFSVADLESNETSI